MYSVIHDKKGGVGKLFLGLGITLAIIVIAVGGVFGYFWNATPESLKIADKEIINGETFRSLGFANMKFKDIVKEFKQVTKADTSGIVQNEPTEEDKTKTDDNVDGATNEGFVTEGGEIDYTVLLSDSLVYDDLSMQTYTDTQLCYVFGCIIDGSIENAMAGENSEGIQFLNDINAAVNEVSIEKNADGVKLRVVMSVSTTKFTDDIKDALGAAYSLLKDAIPETVYAVSYFDIGVNAENDKKLALTSTDMKINDTENTLTKALFKVFASSAAKAGQNVDEMTETEQKAVVNNAIGTTFVGVVYNMGDLGAATDTAANGQLTGTSTVTYGESGIYDGKITLITRKAS